MSSHYPQSHDLTYATLAQEEVQWVWVPLAVKVLPVAPTLPPIFPLSINPYPSPVPACVPSTTTTWSRAPGYDLGTPGWPSGFQGNSTLGELSPSPVPLPDAFDLPSNFGALSTPGPTDLPELDQYPDVPLLPGDFNFADPWAYPTTTPNQGTASPGTATPADSPPAQLYMTGPYPPPLTYPQFDCFESSPQTVYLPKQKQPPTHSSNNSSPKAPPRFRCSQCPKACPNQRTLDRHLWSKHPEYAEHTGVKSIKGKCSQCPYVARVDNVQRHERTVHRVENRGW